MSKIADRVLLVFRRQVDANGAPAALYASSDPLVHQFYCTPRRTARWRFIFRPPIMRRVCWSGCDEGGYQWFGGGRDATVACLAALGNFSLFALALMRHVAICCAAAAVAARDVCGGRVVAADYFGRRAVRRHGAVVSGIYDVVRFGAEQALGTMVALSLLRELGPVVSALLFAGRAGSAITAEVGLMKTTEQLAAMEMMAD